MFHVIVADGHAVRGAFVERSLTVATGQREFVGGSRSCEESLHQAGRHDTKQPFASAGAVGPERLA